METILDKIQQYDTIIIHRHMKPDPDALGSQLGLKEIILENFPHKTVKATGYNEPTLNWLGHMDNVLDQEFKHALIIITDTANTARIDDKRYLYGDYIIKIDHHPNDEPYGDFVYVNTNASSASEIITDFALKNHLKINSKAARYLYAGIIGDTGRFLYPATSSKTFEIASFLVTQPFDFSEVSRQMETMSLKIAQLQSFVYEHLIIDNSGAACVTIPFEHLQEKNISDSETAAIVSAPGRIDNVSAWAIFVQQADGHYRVRLRSKKYPINTIAKKHDGGGHPLASGANSYSIKENQMIFDEIKQLFN